MESNIDLTTGLDFRRVSVKSTNLSSIPIRRIVGHKDIVDIPYCIANDIEHFQRGGIEQGDKYRRSFIKMVHCEVHCECCGRPQKYPWENFNGLLCPQCNSIMESDFTQVPWNRA